MNFSLNSTMVRFKYELIKFINHFMNRSQFHYGSIQINLNIVVPNGEIMSQFHYGSIQIDLANAIMKSETKSQFHYGSIQMLLTNGKK